MDKKPPAVLYMRYSSDKQNEQSIEGQRRVCREYARSEYDIITEYIDRDRTGKNDKREAFQQMIADSKKHKFRYVIVYKLDRFARNRYDSAKYKHILKQNGVRVISATEYLSDSPESIMTEALLEANAEYYSAELAQKTKRGMRESALKGNSTGGTVPLGFKIVNKKYEVDINTVQIPKLIFEMYANGKSKTEIAAALNSKGYKTRFGGEFKMSSLDHILTNEKYIGVLHYNDEKGEIKIDGGCPAIIDKETFNVVQRRLAENKRAPARAAAKVDYLLSGKLYCGECGALMIGESGHGTNDKVYNYYACSNHKRKKACPKKTERKDFVEWYICEAVLSLVTGEDSKHDVAKMIVAAFKKSFGDSGIKDIEKQLKAVRCKIENVVDMIAETGNRALMAKLEALQKQEDEILDELELARIDERRIPTVPQIESWLTELAGLDICDPKARYHLINIFVNRVYLYDDRMILFFNMGNKNKTVSLKDIREIEKNSEVLNDFDLVDSCVTSNISRKSFCRLGLRVLLFSLT